MEKLFFFLGRRVSTTDSRDYCASVENREAANAAASVVVEEGQKFEVERQFTAEDVASYVQLSGDTNPIHTSDSAAQAAGFQRPVVQGMLYAGLFPAVIGSHFVSNLSSINLVGLSKDLQNRSMCECKTCTVQIAQTISKSENLEHLCALEP